MAVALATSKVAKTVVPEASGARPSWTGMGWNVYTDKRNNRWAVELPRKVIRVIVGYGQDRLFDPPLNELLRARNIDNLLLVGWRENGSVLYTAVGASLRSYTVIVADDGTSAAQDYDVAIGRYQRLAQLNANANNDPLKKAEATLSRTDLIIFQ
jgi:nicotinamidase-related amidase